MTLPQILIAVAGVLLAAAAVLTLVRLARGPSGLDRGVAGDVFVAILVASVAAWTIAQRTPVALGVLVVLSIVGFTGTVALARLITTTNVREQRFHEARVDDGYAEAPGRRPRLRVVELEEPGEPGESGEGTDGTP